MKKKIFVRGPVLSQSGYGEQARFALRALKSREDLLFHIDVLIGEYLQSKHITKNDAILVRSCWHDWIDRNVQILAA